MILNQNKTKPCPCGSNKRFDLCCGPYINGVKKPSTAKALMKSRFTAYALANEEYLKATWHPFSCPQKLELNKDKTQWQQLKILGSKKGKSLDKKGWVAFAAFYLDESGQQGVLKEESLFVREAGQWLYHSGTPIED
ncbi:YchJ family protein [Litoribacillus peritrichatus]|uniref:YchJ family protein n=1 Tax=Litoribacillus peritrichatus TaxID=718191 RepID=A0ABP7MXK9_9GAMM